MGFKRVQTGGYRMEMTKWEALKLLKLVNKELNDRLEIEMDIIFADERINEMKRYTTFLLQKEEL